MTPLSQADCAPSPMGPGQVETVSENYSVKQMLRKPLFSGVENTRPLPVLVTV